MIYDLFSILFCMLDCILKNDCIAVVNVCLVRGNELTYCRITFGEPTAIMNCRCRGGGYSTRGILCGMPGLRELPAIFLAGGCGCSRIVIGLLEL